MWVIGRRVAKKKKQATYSTKRIAYLTYKEEARAMITPMVEAWAQAHGFVPKRIAIKDTKRSWGSCSALGNLNFNYKLLFLPRCLAEYIVVHELCHLRHLHHGADFWLEVAKIMPDYESRRQAIKDHERLCGTGRPWLLQLQASHQIAQCQSCQGSMINSSDIIM